MTHGLEELQRAGVLSAVDVRFAQTLARLTGENDERVCVAAALASRAVGASSVCVDLVELRASASVRDQAGAILADPCWPEADAWLAAIAASPLVSLASDPERRATPLVLDGGRLYLERYWFYETRVAELLTERADGIESVDAIWLSRALDRVGLEARASAPNAQRLAAAVALRQRLCVVSGGPGTGKTYTVAKILALLAERAIERDGRPPRVALLAPTGKAAARLSESIRRELPGLACSDAVRASIPTAAATIHRFLGLVPDPRRARGEAPLVAADTVIVDEVSMVDIGLLYKLLVRLPAAARLVLLGDPNQLASVEAGTVLADLVAPPGTGYSRELADDLDPVIGAALPRSARTPLPAIADGMVELTESRRFRRHPGIGALATAIHTGDTGRVIDVLRSDQWPEVEWVQHVDESAIAALSCAHFDSVQREESAPGKLAALERFRVLCAHRDGRQGAAGINAAVESALTRAGRITRSRGSYAGQPILIERNDYQVGLFNGDVGLILAAGAHLSAAFPADSGRIREIAPSRLPRHSTVFAMTIHKSQGSEFDEVAVVLPTDRSRVSSRELLYTAVTRAKARVRIYATEEALSAAVATCLRRASGLRQRVWRDLSLRPADAPH